MLKQCMLIVFMLLIITPVNAETIEWYTYEKGLEEASLTGKPIFIDFYADWCQPCIAMENGTYPDPRVASEMKDFIAIKVNTQVRVDIEDKYHISYYPTVVFLDPSGTEISRHVGYLGPEDMVKEIRDTQGKVPKEAYGFEAFPMISVALMLTLIKKL